MVVYSIYYVCYNIELQISILLLYEYLAYSWVYIVMLSRTIVVLVVCIW